ncbi:hypothetical protein CC77DRAFT_148667 [Alternaria alternata]|jgi:hypothetical protein|uniref:Uncharacterized protein n=1 Tax=Alternaria alternata TaxID=5599 RepID=A0A177DJV4_ALTAL|nr:hypothetical protein CC77DRAFT_148667 [Alternaria alternata]OAG19995.1 hypothetical protein CC77DRAFT_148667 [Alternaria alternata]
MQKFAGMRTKANVVRKMSLTDETGEILSIAEDWICPARAVAFAELITFLLPNPALLRWRLYVLRDARDCTTESQWCLVKYLHRRQDIRDYIACVRRASQMSSAKGCLWFNSCFLTLAIACFLAEVAAIVR